MVMVIDHDGRNYICGYCRRTARMLPRTIEEFAAGRKELWIHHVDKTPICPSKTYAREMLESLKEE